MCKVSLARQGGDKALLCISLTKQNNVGCVDFVSFLAVEFVPVEFVFVDFCGVESDQLACSGPVEVQWQCAHV